MKTAVFDQHSLCLALTCKQISDGQVKQQSIVRLSQHCAFLQQHHTEHEIEHESWAGDDTERRFKGIFWLAFFLLCKSSWLVYSRIRKGSCLVDSWALRHGLVPLSAAMFSCFCEDHTVNVSTVCYFARYHKKYHNILKLHYSYNCKVLTKNCRQKNNKRLIFEATVFYVSSRFFIFRLSTRSGCYSSSKNGKLYTSIHKNVALLHATLNVIAKHNISLGNYLFSSLLCFVICITYSLTGLEPLTRMLLKLISSG